MSSPADRPGWTVVPALVRLAEVWPATVSTHPDDDRGLLPPPLRCNDAECGQEIYPPNVQGRLAHLLTAHGYRMDGTCRDDNNRIRTTAAEELIVRAAR